MSIARNTTILPAAIVGTAAVVLAGSLLTPAAAGAVETAPSAQSGSVVVPDDSDVTIGSADGGISVSSSSNVGGGTWNYGSERSGTKKKCYSSYMNRIAPHGATAIIGSAVKSVDVKTGQWANASALGGLTQRCDAYWRLK